MSTSAEYAVNSGSVPANSKPASLRTVLRPPSQPTSQRARNACAPAYVTTASPRSSSPSIAVPRRRSTPSARARAASTDSTTAISAGKLLDAGLGRRQRQRDASTWAASMSMPAKWPACPRRAVEPRARGEQRVEKPAPVERLGRRHGQPARAEWPGLERRVGAPGPLVDEHVESGEREFAREEEADRAGAGDEDVVQTRRSSGMHDGFDRMGGNGLRRDRADLAWNRGASRQSKRTADPPCRVTRTRQRASGRNGQGRGAGAGPNRRRGSTGPCATSRAWLGRAALSTIRRCE